MDYYGITTVYDWELTNRRDWTPKHVGHGYLPQAVRGYVFLTITVIETLQAFGIDDIINMQTDRSFLFGLESCIFMHRRPRRYSYCSSGINMVVGRA